MCRLSFAGRRGLLLRRLQIWQVLHQQTAGPLLPRPRCRLQLQRDFPRHQRQQRPRHRVETVEGGARQALTVITIEERKEF